jgi:hypothetical protein
MQTYKFAKFCIVKTFSMLKQIKLNKYIKTFCLFFFFNGLSYYYLFYKIFTTMSFTVASGYITLYLYSVSLLNVQRQI